MSNVPDEMSIDKFKLISCLASGAHSQIWECTDTSANRQVAMKLLLPESLAAPEQKSSLKNEAKVGASFDHPNILKYYGTVMTKKHGYFTMELFRAPNLKAQIYGDLHGVQLRIKRLIEMISIAIEHVHEKGWIHKDIKPENILVNKASEVRLIDFSLSCRVAGALGKMFGGKQVVQGTRTYMAPEQILGKTPLPQTDMYSFGITIFEMLTGEPPFKGSTPKDLLVRHINEPAPAPSFFNPNVSPEMDRFVQRLLAKKPENRFKKMAEMLVELRNITVFKEAIQEQVAKTEAEIDEEALKNVDKRLDSRRDALRSKVAGGAAPDAAAQPATPAATPAAAPAVAAKPPAPAAPVPPGPAPAPPAPAMQPAAMAPPGYGMPQQGYGYPPGYSPQPGYAMPSQGYNMPPGYGYPPGYAPPQGYGYPPGYAPPPGYAAPPGYAPAPGQMPMSPAQPGASGASPALPQSVAPPAAAQPVPATRPPQPKASPANAPQPGASQPGIPQPGASQPAAAKPAPPKPATAQPAPPKPAPRPATRPAAPQPARGSNTPPKPTPAHPGTGDGMSIEDMPFFDELPPIA